jgi:hypothetical protein
VKGIDSAPTNEPPDPLKLAHDVIRLWRAELQAGARRVTDTDSLAVAAAWAAGAIELFGEGFREAAQNRLARIRAIVGDRGATVRGAGSPAPPRPPQLAASVLKAIRPTHYARRLTG